MYEVSLAWVWSRFTVLRVQIKESDRKAYFYPMERAGRLGYDHIYYEGDWVFLTSLPAVKSYLEKYAKTSPGERNKLRPFVKGVKHESSTSDSSRADNPTGPVRTGSGPWNSNSNRRGETNDVHTR